MEELGWIVNQHNFEYKMGITFKAKLMGLTKK